MAYHNTKNGANGGGAINQIPIPKGRWLRILPIMLIACIISYMDRVNIAFALPGGMAADLGINPEMAGMAAGIFFIGYLFLQVPAGRLAVYGDATKFIGWSLFSWFIISVLIGFVQSYNQLLVLRFALGVAEGGMLPVMLTMISNWFPDHERARANATLIMFVPLAGMFTAPLSGFLIEDYGWRVLFFVTGAISLVATFLWFAIISNRPQEAKWISEAEKEYILACLKAEQAAILQVPNAANVGEVSAKTSLKAVLANSVLWRLTLVWFLYQIGIYGYTIWLPEILKDLTQGSMQKVGFLTILPFLACMAGMFFHSYFSDKTGRRKWFIAAPLLGFSICLILSVVLKYNTWYSYAALVGCGFFMQAAAGIFWAVPAKIFDAQSAGSARGVINALGNLGGFVGPYMVGALIAHSSKDMGVYSLALALFLAAAVSMLFLPTVYKKP